ncbi:hypothetical protein EK21DRAFT_92045 [Setomelanomma holmii]|uniref:Apple domain-containing protein n=1 Tax=Setomelanomma holmii TaxID=210430 RepID=A0A9P4H508_9PLEO|nr:hypothetical protein EK21DRAFT_92045 [Setomelanomma holmii]
MFFLAPLVCLSSLPLILASPAPTPAPELRSLEKRACAADNCLRAFRNRIVTAVPFCESYTTTSAAPIPTWASGCSANPTRVSSACACLQTAALTKVYGPVDNTNYTIFEQSVNIRSDPGPAPDEYFNDCYNMCTDYGARCQTFSFAQMPNGFGEPGGLYLCYM